MPILLKLKLIVYIGRSQTSFWTWQLLLKKKDSLFHEEVLKVIKEGEDDNHLTVIAAEKEKK